MTTVLYMPIIFSLAITIHNIEEAICLPKWSQQASKYQKQVSEKEFHFAVTCVTILAYLVSLLFVLFDEFLVVRYIFFGFVGTMIVNVFLPHLVATIMIRKYAPGLLSGILINIPFLSMIVYNAIRLGYITVLEMIIVTFVFGVSLLSLLPLLFKTANKLFVS